MAIYDSSNARLYTSDVKIRLYLSPSSSLQGPNWSFKLANGIYNFNIHINCLGSYTLYASSYGYTDGLYSPFTKLMNSNCNSLIITSSLTSVSTNQTFTLSALTSDYLNNPITCNYNIYEVLDGKVMGTTSLSNANTLSSFNIYLLSPGTKKLMIVCSSTTNTIISNTIEVTVTGSKIYYLKIVFVNPVKFI